MPSARPSISGASTTGTSHKNTLDAWQGVEGGENVIQLSRRSPSMRIIPKTPTSSEVLAGLLPNDGRTTILAETEVGTFSAALHRYDFRDDRGEAGSGEIELVIDNSQQDGGEAWHDLTILRSQAKNFAKVAVEMIAATAAFDDLEIERDTGGWAGEWYAAGTKGTPSLVPIPGEPGEAYCSTTWQETGDGRRTEPTLHVEARSAFTPTVALEFAVHLAEEAGRAMRIAGDGREVVA